MWRALITAFGLVFLAELGDKTQLTTMLLASQAKSIWPVLIGSALALILSSILGVFLGSFLNQYIPPRMMRTGAGIAFLIIGVVLLWK